MENNVVSLAEYVEKQFKALHEHIVGADYNANSLPIDFPISRATYYNWKKNKTAGGVRTCTILKACKFLDWPEPKIFF